MSDNFRIDLQNELGSLCLNDDIRRSIDLSLNISTHIEFGKSVYVERETDELDIEIDEIISQQTIINIV